MEQRKRVPVVARNLEAGLLISGNKCLFRGPEIRVLMGTNNYKQ